MNVVVTRERGANETLRSLVPVGVSVVEIPLTTTQYFDARRVRDSLRASEHFGRAGAVVVTSARAARYADLARDALGPGGRVVGVGAATARALSVLGTVADVVGRGGALDLAPALGDGPVVLLGALAMREELARELRARSVAVTAVACYETRPVRLGAEDAAALRDADVVFIGAPSAWRVARDAVCPDAWVVVPGATTGVVVRQSHEKVFEGWGERARELLASLA